jgi:cobalt-zinc-cadmium efflux system protein
MWGLLAESPADTQEPGAKLVMEGSVLHRHRRSGDMGRVLVWSLAATSLFVVVEAAAGIRAHSLSLLSDAAHNFTDALALLLAWFGVFFGRKPADNVKTYGYHRAGVLAAFLNALSLLILAGYILFESYQRWLHPRTVDEMTMLVVAAGGVILNGAIMWGLHAGRVRDVNIRGAWLHMLGDALGSLGIVAGAVVIHYTGWERTDPLLSALIGLLIVWTAWDVVKETLNILLEGLPRGLELDRVTAAMRQIPEVLDVHDVHIWSLGSSTHALSCHVRIEDVPPSESESILEDLNRVLYERFHIEHTTVQFEHVSCPGCPIPNGRGHTDEA